MAVIIIVVHQALSKIAFHRLVFLCVQLDICCSAWNFFINVNFSRFFSSPKKINPFAAEKKVYFSCIIFLDKLSVYRKQLQFSCVHEN